MRDAQRMKPEKKIRLVMNGEVSYWPEYIHLRNTDGSFTCKRTLQCYYEDIHRYVEQFGEDKDVYFKRVETLQASMERERRDEVEATNNAVYVFFQLQRYVTSPDTDHSFDRMLRIALPDGSDLEYPEAIERAKSGPWDPKAIIHVAAFGLLKVEMHPDGRTVLKELGEPVLVVTPEPKENKQLGDVLKKGNWMVQLACIAKR